MILEYDTSGLSQKDKIRLYQRLYGTKKTDIKTRKTYTYPGIIGRTGARKIGKSAIIIDIEQEEVFRHLFESFSVSYVKTEIYQAQ